MSNSKTAMTIKGLLIGYYEVSPTFVKLWDEQDRLLHNSNDIDDLFMAKFFNKQVDKLIHKN